MRANLSPVYWIPGMDDPIIQSHTVGFSKSMLVLLNKVKTGNSKLGKGTVKE